MRKWAIIGIVLLALGLSRTSTLMADDTDIYVAGVDNVAPNVLIIFDNSGSMNREMPSVEYDPNFVYPNVLGVESSNTVYYKSGGNLDTKYRDSIEEIKCPDARDALGIYGYFKGVIIDYLNAADFTVCAVQYIFSPYNIAQVVLGGIRPGGRITGPLPRVLEIACLYCLSVMKLHVFPQVKCVSPAVVTDLPVSGYIRCRFEVVIEAE